MKYPAREDSVPHARDELARFGPDRGGVDGGRGELGVAEHRGDGRKRHAAATAATP